MTGEERAGATECLAKQAALDRRRQNPLALQRLHVDRHQAVRQLAIAGLTRRARSMCRIWLRSITSRPARFGRVPGVSQKANFPLIAVGGMVLVGALRWGAVNRLWSLARHDMAGETFG